MSFTPYVDPPFSSILFVSGTGAPQAAYDGVLSYQADAAAYAKAIGATLFNAATDPRFTFVGVKPTDAAQPWAVEWGTGGSNFFAGIAINQQVEATYLLIGTKTTQYPGTWGEATSGVWLFTPQPLTPVVVPPVTSNPADVSGWLAAMNVPTVTLQQIAAAIAYGFSQLGVKTPPQ